MPSPGSARPRASASARTGSASVSTSAIPLAQASAASSSSANERCGSTAVAMQRRVTSASSARMPAASLSLDTHSTSAKRRPGQSVSSVRRSARESGVCAVEQHVAEALEPRRQLERAERASSPGRSARARKRSPTATASARFPAWCAPSTGFDLAPVSSRKRRPDRAVYVERHDALERRAHGDALRGDRAPGLASSPWSAGTSARKMPAFSRAIASSV
jgi:hypothetical protein